MSLEEVLPRRWRTLKQRPVVLSRSTGTAQRRARIFRWMCVLFLFAGNAARLIHVPGLTDNLLISEIILDLAAFLLLVISGSARRAFYRYASPLVLIVCMSVLIGVMQWGVLPIPIIYGVRLILGVTVGVLLGNALFIEFGTDARRAMQKSLWFYIVLVVTSLMILLLFPDAQQLWKTLGQYGIRFNGDPHQKRLLSTYFDPNFFAIILLLPLSWSFAYFLKYFRPFWLTAFLIFVLAILLTGSRSGLAAAGLILLLLLLKRAAEALLMNINVRKALRYVLILPALLLVCLPFYAAALLQTVHRIASISDDRSAAARFDSLSFGWNVIRDHLWFGVGYNYLSVLTERYRGLSSLDSSMQVMLANFGVLLSAALLLLALASVWLDIRRVPSHLRFLLHAQLVCLAVTLLFAAQFNNVAFYMFWLIPALAGSVYLSRCSSRPVSEAQT